MRKVVIHNLSDNSPNKFKAHYCDSFFSRLRGLTFHAPLLPYEGILLVQDRESRIDTSIHMLGVFFDLAVFWINANYEIVDVKLARSWRLAYFPAAPARYILELDSQYLDSFKVGDRVEILDESKNSV